MSVTLAEARDDLAEHSARRAEILAEALTQALVAIGRQPEPEPEPAALTAEQWREAFFLGARTALRAVQNRPAPDPSQPVQLRLIRGGQQ